MRKLRGAVVGVGYLGKFHAQKYASLSSEVDFVGVVDPNQKAGQALAQELKTSYFENVSQILGQVDVATVATPTTFHFAVADSLLKAGCHLLVEKPLAKTVQEGEQLVRTARAAGLTLQVGHIERFNPVFLELQKRVKSPRQIQAVRVAPFKPRALDVDVATDLMIHDIELISHLMGETPRVLDVQGRSIFTKTWDYVHASFGFSGGRSASITVSRAHPTAQRSLFVLDEDRSFFADLGTLELTEVTRPTRDPQDPAGTDLKKVTVDKHDAMLEETKAFLKAVREKSEPPVTGEQALDAMRVLEQVLERLG